MMTTTAAEPEGGRRALWASARARARGLLPELDLCTLRNLVTLGICVRLMFMMATDGSNDIHTFAKFARQLNSWGLIEQYIKVETFNHSPLIAYWTKFARYLSIHTGLPFSFLWKLLPFTADVVAIGVLIRAVRARAGELVAWRAAAIFALSPVSFWVTGHHGNTDSLCALLVLITALLLDRKLFFFAGLCFALSLNVKLLPMMIFPALVLSRRSIREVLSAAAGFCLGLLPFLPIVVYAWDEYYRNAIEYNSHPNRWGIHMFLWAGYDLESGDWFQWADETWQAWARYVIMLLSAATGLFARLRGWSHVRMVAVVIAIFLFLTPGIGVQYFILPLLPLVVVDRKRALIYSVLMGAYLTAVYLHFWDGKWPLRSRHSHPIREWVGVVGIPAWFFFLELIVSSVRRPRLRPEAESSTTEA